MISPRRLLRPHPSAASTPERFTTLDLGGYEKLSQQLPFNTRRQLETAMADQVGFVKSQLLLARKGDVNPAQVEEFAANPDIMKAIHWIFKNQYFDHKGDVQTRRESPNVPSVYHDVQVGCAYAQWLRSLPEDHSLYLKPGSLPYTALVITALMHDGLEDSERVLREPVDKQRAIQKALKEEIYTLFRGTPPQGRPIPLKRTLFARLIVEGIDFLTNPVGDEPSTQKKIDLLTELARKAGDEGQRFLTHVFIIKLFDNGNNLYSDAEYQRQNRVTRTGDRSQQMARLEKKIGSVQGRLAVMRGMPQIPDPIFIGMFEELCVAFERERELLAQRPDGFLARLPSSVAKMRHAAAQRFKCLI
jgi:hypothetical protein